MRKDYYLLVGYFNISKYESSIRTITNEVILTNERLSHIIDKHPEVLIYLNKIKNILKDPDMVFIQTNKDDTVWVVKKIVDNLKITIKLSTIRVNDLNYKNSIIQMQYMNDKELERNISIGKVKEIYNKKVELYEKV